MVKNAEGRDDPLIQSYVRKKWFVSTIHRRSSVAIQDPPWFYETLVFEWDYETKKTSTLIGQFATPVEQEALVRHLNICVNLPALPQEED